MTDEQIEAEIHEAMATGDYTLLEKMKETQPPKQEN